MVKFTYFYALTIILIVLGTIETEHFPIILTFGALTLSHFPALLPVAIQQKVLPQPSKLLWKYPEVPVVLLILASWVMITLITSDWLESALTGFLSIISIGASYVAVRLINHLPGLSKKTFSFLPNFNIEPYLKLRNRGLYLLRGIATLMSFTFASLIVFGQPELIISFLLFITLLLSLLTLTFFSRRFGLSIIRRVNKFSTQMVTNSLGKNPPNTAIHYSCPSKSSHENISDLLKTLAGENIIPAVIARERHSMNALKRQTSSNLWHCATMNQLDQLAQPCFDAIFYVNDAPKNSHCIRFDQYKHILIPTGELASAAKLDRNCEIYSAIIAPSLEKAKEWRNAATDNLAKLILTVDSYNTDEFKFDKPSRYPPLKPTMTLYLDNLEADATKIIKLMNSVLDNKVAYIELWLPDIQTPPSNKKLENILSAWRDQRGEYAGKENFEFNLSIKIGSAVEAANAGDYLIIHRESELAELQKTAKPLLWAGDGPPPPNTIELGYSSSDLSICLDTALRSLLDIKEANCNTHFDNWADLVTEVCSSNKG